MDEAEKYMSENEDEIKAELEALLDEIESAEKSVETSVHSLNPLTKKESQSLWKKTLTLSSQNRRKSSLKLSTIQRNISL